MEAAGGWVRFRTGGRLLVLACATALTLLPGERVSTAEKVEWLASHAASLRSINPKDRDYSDLRPLQKAIGNARVVLLGGTNDAGIVTARERLVRFLHEEMGFDVLTSDLPLFDGEEYDRSLDNGKAPRPDLELLNAPYFASYNPPHSGLELLDYVRDTHKTEHPLHLAGFGSAVSTFMATEYAKRLFLFVDHIDPNLASPADRKAIHALLALCAPAINVYGRMGQRIYGRREWDKTVTPGLAALFKIYSGLGHLPQGRPDLSEVIFYRQTLVNLAMYAAGRAHHPLDAHPASSAVVLAKIWRPASKIIVWSGNFTIGRNWPPLKRPNSLTPIAARTTGMQLSEALGEDAYAIAFREIKNDNGVLQVLEAGSQPKLAPVDGDLESLLHAAGKPVSFVDFRGLSAGHWLRSPLSARLLVSPEVFVWPDHFDGLITVDLPAWKDWKEHK